MASFGCEALLYQCSGTKAPSHRQPVARSLPRPVCIRGRGFAHEEFWPGARSPEARYVRGSPKEGYSYCETKAESR
jgi:hypothetical protein